MIITEIIDDIFTLVKRVKKPIVKIYPDGKVVGTDEQFASLNVVFFDNNEYVIPCPLILFTKDITAFMREVNPKYCLLIYPYTIATTIPRGQILTLDNHVELSNQIDDLYNRVLSQELTKPILYKEQDFQNSNPEMFSLKVSDGAKMYNIDKQFLMSSFNAIHPATKTDKIDLVIRDSDPYSYTAEFMIHKKKENYTLHEILRFRKL